MKKIVWALDYSGMTPALGRRVTAMLRTLSHSDEVVIQPVSVVNESPSLGRLPDYFVEQVAESLRKLAAQSGLDNVLEPKLLFCRAPSQRKSVEVLVNFARKSQADAIVVASFSRRGMSRWFLGSFAETLIMQSPVPIVVVNPKNRVQGKVDHILVPVGNASRAKVMFGRVVGLAKDLGAKITILGQIDFPVLPSAYYQDFVGPEGQVSFDSYIEKNKKKLRMELTKLRDLAQKKGVKAKVEIGTEVVGIAEKILFFAEQNKVDLIAMGNESGPIGSVLLGSVSREVVRKAQIPVWIVHQ